MAILIINNYPSEKDLFKIDEIKKALLNLGISDVMVWKFSEIADQSISENVEAIILSGSDSHINKPEHLEMYHSEIELVRKVNIPILGICFGHQLIGVAFGSKLDSLQNYTRDFISVKVLKPDEIFSSWKEGDFLMLNQYHKDYLSELPKGFVCLAESKNCKIEAMKHQTRPIYGVQAHIERATDENPDGLQILKNFVENVVERNAVVQVVKTRSLPEIKQAIIDSLRDIEYDVIREDTQKVESKLKGAQKYLEAWVIKRLIDALSR